ncbi:uncharacterized protein isoform X1 [Rhodnius prolixus]|uniref:uncharacterized protein isoform X1 n=1 Tax=Rhodnius prolixus TaxID=13249 RepID=UPI003D18B66C
MKVMLLPALIFMFYTILPANSIVCFKCYSAKDDNCLVIEGESKKYLVSCHNASDPAAEFKCLETLTQVSGTEVHKVNRDCISKERYDYCGHLKSGDSIMTVLLCKMCDDKDGCNGGDYFLSGSKRNLENAYFLVINSVIWFTLSIYQRLNENV